MPSCNGYAPLLASGQGGPKDAAQARSILTASCDKKYGIACSNLVAYHEQGRGGPVDLAKGREYAELACKYSMKIRCPK